MTSLFCSLALTLNGTSRCMVVRGFLVKLGNLAPQTFLEEVKLAKCRELVSSALRLKPGKAARVVDKGAVAGKWL